MKKKMKINNGDGDEHEDRNLISDETFNTFVAKSAANFVPADVFMKTHAKSAANSVNKGQFQLYRQYLMY